MIHDARIDLHLAVCGVKFLSVLLGNLAVLYCTVCAVRNKGEIPRNEKARTECRDTRQVDGVTLAGTTQE